uniref:Uncharacterized protein n=1 Tax=Anguilla anguilla TaxID=7936 RepID=A0A0E9WXV5_ANGAN
MHTDSVTPVRCPLDSFDVFFSDDARKKTLFSNPDIQHLYSSYYTFFLFLTVAIKCTLQSNQLFFKWKILRNARFSFTVHAGMFRWSASTGYI